MIDQVVGNFQIVRELGRGGMGAVYEGVDLMLKRRVAIKIVHPELGRDPVFSERFQKEAMALARLNHPNVTSVYSFSREGEQLILAMELVEGEPLDTWLRTWGALAWQDAGRLAAAALDGLDHAHQNGIIHRDVKPSNLLLTAAGQGIKIMDFGIAHILGERRLTRMGSVVGTIEYMSPEQVAGSELDARTDLYSMGVVLYEMLTGRVPFSGGSDFELMRAQMESVPQSPAELANDVPEWLEGIILRALAKAPDDRYQSATAFAGEIRRGLVDSGEAATATDAAVSAAVVAPAQSPPAGRPAVSVTERGGSRPAAPSGVRPPAAPRRLPGWLVPGATAGLMVVAVILVAAALLQPGTEPESAPDVVPRAQVRTAVVARPSPPPTSLGAATAAPQTSRPGSLQIAPAPASRPPVPAPSRPPASTPVPVAAAADTKVARSQTRPAPEPAAGPAAVSADPGAEVGTVPSAASDGAAVAPEPATAEEPAAPAQSPPPSGSLPELGSLAERIENDSGRLLAPFRAFLSAEGRWPPRDQDRVLRDQLEALEQAADRLLKAYDVVADREGLAGPGRSLRKLRAKTRRYTGINQADRDTVWQRAGELVEVGRSVEQLMSQIEVDEVTRVAWQQTLAGLEQLDQLVPD